MRIRLKSDRIILFEKKDEPILLDLVQNKYFIYKNYDECCDFFLKQFKNCKIKYDFEKYEDKIFFFDEKDEIIGEYNLKSYNFWMDYNKIWSRFNLNYIYIKVLTRYLVETHFELKCGATGSILDKFPLSVETYFKMRCESSQWTLTELMPSVGAHFKMRCEDNIHT